MPNNALLSRTTPNSAAFNIVERKKSVAFKNIGECRWPAASNGKVVSLFTGAGGMEIGLEMAGYQTVACVEIDADCRATLRKNRPQWVQIKPSKANSAEGDVRSTSISDILQQSSLTVGEASLVTGGAPCQPFSNMGKKLGSNDARNGDLFKEFVRIVMGLQPKAFIFENVAGINHERHSHIVNYMSECFLGSGYKVAFHVLNAADYGVPQTRKRFIMIGRKNSPPLFPLPTHTESDLSEARLHREIALESGVSFKRWVSVKEAFSHMASSMLIRDDNLHMKHSDEMIRRISLVKQGKNFKSLPKEILPNCWKNGKHQGHDTFGRIVEDRPAPTIRTAGYNPTKGRYIHPWENRGLSTMEMAALQSFPADWQFTTEKGRPSIVSIGKQIGNAVPPLLARAIGLSIAD